MDGRREDKPNIIFLDIDGVLNSYDTKDRFQGFVGIDDRLVAVLKAVVDKTGAKLVLSSSWKSEWTNDPELVNDECYDTGRYLNAKLSKYGLKILDKTKDDGINRGFGIRRWLDEHEHGNWIVLDDEVFPDFALCGILPQLVYTKPDRRNVLHSENSDESEDVFVFEYIEGSPWDGLKDIHIDEAVQKMQQEIAYPKYYDIREKEDTDVDGFSHSGKGL